MKIFAFYLPQFHRIPENDLWWGEGFTEWTNVRKAQRITRNQYQPRIPLNNNYYNLLDDNTIVWQSKLLNKYKIDGLIYYHYYFKGKKLLEKPAEKMLANKDIKNSFFFCWANHTWNRSWNGTKEILLEQVYGTIEDWENHFQYLLPFFKDSRYEKIDNKPVFMIFKSVFSEKNNILNYFNKRCMECGFSGLYCFETSPELYSKNYSIFKENLLEFSSPFYREPELGLFFERRKNKFKLFNRCLSFLSKRGYCSYVWTYKGDKCLNNSLHFHDKLETNATGLFFEWDNTPRHGKRGYIVTPISKKMFYKYMNSTLNKEYIFINAWNEWCEGMIMEPTEKDGYKYLEWIKEWREINHV